MTAASSRQCAASSAPSAACTRTVWWARAPSSPSPGSRGALRPQHHGGCPAVSRLADTLAQIDEKRERGEDLGRIPRLEERATPRRAWRIVGTLVIVGSMGVLSLGVWLQPHVPAGPAMTPATIAAAMPVTAPAVTSRDRAASLIQDGLNAVRDGQIQAAAAAFREASDLAPDDA